MSSKGPSTFQKCTMEFLSSFIIVFTIQNTAPKTYGAFAVAVSFFIGVFLAAKVSGAHLNPAVTFMVYLNDKERNPHSTQLITYVPYVCSQILGALLGALLSDVLGGATLSPVIKNMSLTNAFFAEAFFTFFLCVGVSVIADPHSGMDPAMCGLVVCTLIFITAVSIGPYTSGVVNPAIGIALVVAGDVVKGIEDFSVLPLYIIAPLAGAYGAHQLYIKIIRPGMQQETTAE